MYQVPTLWLQVLFALSNQVTIMLQAVKEENAKVMYDPIIPVMQTLSRSQNIFQGLFDLYNLH